MEKYRILLVRLSDVKQSRRRNLPILPIHEPWHVYIAICLAVMYSCLDLCFRKKRHTLILLVLIQVELLQFQN